MAKEVYCGPKPVSNGRRYASSVNLRYHAKEDMLIVNAAQNLNREGIDRLLREWLTTQTEKHFIVHPPLSEGVYDIRIEHDPVKEQLYTFSNAGKEGVYTAGIISHCFSKKQFSPDLEGKL